MDACSIFVGTFGAGMNAQLSLPANRHIVELHPPFSAMNIHETLSHYLDQPYTSIQGEFTGPELEPLHRDFTIDVDAVIQTVEQLIAQPA